MRSPAVPGRVLRRSILALACGLAAGEPGSASGQSPPVPVPTLPPVTSAEPTVEERLRRLEDANRALAEQNRDLMQRYEELMNRHEEVLQRIDPAASAPSPNSLEAEVSGLMSGAVGPLGEAGTDIGEGPAVDPSAMGGGVLESPGTSAGTLEAEVSGLMSGAVGPLGEAGTDIGEGPADGLASGEGMEELFENFGVGYDDGFIIAPKDEDETPYLLKINGRWQLRYFNFDRDREFWWNSAGDRLPIHNRNEFQLVRGRLSFEGFFHDPRLQYYLLINYTTNNSNLLVAQNYWVNYEFSEAINLYFGKNYVPGSREWLEGSTRMQFADRSMATAFFRPGRTIGIWAIGEPIEQWFYQVMIGDSFRNDNLGFPNIDDNLVYSGSFWWEPRGRLEGGSRVDPFGRGYSDLEWHEDLAVRLGTSFSYSDEDGLRQPIPGPLEEEDYARLSDGTLLIREGALAPGVTVNRFNHYLWAIDAAIKYRGFSLNGELYQRWFQGIHGDGPLPRSSLYAYGFYAAAGYFVVPERVELMARTSQIWGQYGSGAEYAGGFNWFINGSHYLKFTFDASRVIGSPAQASSPGYRAGDNGLMLRAQFQAAF